MIFWLICAGMTAAVLLAVTRPLSGAPGERSGTDADADLAIYRDQLREIEADRARGVLSDAEAEAGRVEVSRRLLARADRSEAEKHGTLRDRAAMASRRHRIALYGTALLAPLAALALYLTLGSPATPDLPRVSRASGQMEGGASIPELVSQVEARLRNNPDDGRGWDVIAPIYLRLDQFDNAAQAYQNSIRLLGESSRRWLGAGEAIALAKNGVVSEDARRAFQRALDLEPSLLQPRFWLALAKEQDGDLTGALVAFRVLLADAPAEPAWRETIDERINALSARLGEQGAGPASASKAMKGPSAEDIAAAEALSPAERGQMIDRMIAGLAAHLKSDGKDLTGWQSLLRAYVVLGRKSDALSALADARRALAGDSGALASLDQFAASLGLDS